MKKLRAIAEIEVDAQRGWTLPSFGSKKPFRYWAHVHFEKDQTWGQRTWTLLVDLENVPDAAAGHVEASVFFMALMRRKNCLRKGRGSNCFVERAITPPA